MKIHYTHDAIVRLSCDVLAFAVFQDSRGAFAESPAFKAMNEALGGELAKICASEHFKGKGEQSVMVHTLGKLKAERLLVIGVGEREKFTFEQDRHFAATAVRRATAARAATLALVPATIDLDQAQRAQALALGARLAAYRFDRYRTKDKKEAPEKLAEVMLHLHKSKAIDDAIQFSKTLAHAITTARDLINEPAGVVTPEAFAREAKQLAKASGVACQILEPADLKREKMGMLLAVGQGSENTPRVVHLSYVPKKKKSKRKVVLIGKGVTFDSGGLSLKPAQGMEDMKTDMSGGAAVIAAMAVVPELDLDFEVHGLVGLVENMPSGSAYRPGDVLISRAGITVEVNNTDAEGRLVLGDVINYAKDKIAPTTIIDLATLTGACIVALGPLTAGVFSNNDHVAEALLGAAKRAGEDMWRMPLTDGLREQLKSDVADMKNTGERYGGAITAALFLREFVGATPWAHIDIAGPSQSHKEKGVLSKGGTGFGVATLVELLTHVDTLPEAAPKGDEHKPVKAAKPQAVKTRRVA